MLKNVLDIDMLDILGKLTRWDDLIGLNSDLTSFRETAPIELYYWFGKDAFITFFNNDFERLSSILLIVEWIDSISEEKFKYRNPQFTSKNDFVQKTPFDVLVKIAKSYEKDKLKEAEQAIKAELKGPEIEIDLIKDEETEIYPGVSLEFINWLGSITIEELIAMTGTDDIQEVLDASPTYHQFLLNKWEESGTKLRRDVRDVVIWLNTFSPEVRKYKFGYAEVNKILLRLGMCTLLVFKKAVQDQEAAKQRAEQQKANKVERANRVPEGRPNPANARGPVPVHMPKSKQVQASEQQPKPVRVVVPVKKMKGIQVGPVTVFLPEGE